MSPLSLYILWHQLNRRVTTAIIHVDRRNFHRLKSSPTSLLQCPSPGTTQPDTCMVDIDPFDIARLSAGRERLRQVIQAALPLISRGMDIGFDGNLGVRDNCRGHPLPQEGLSPIQRMLVWPCYWAIQAWLKQQVSDMKTQSTTYGNHDPSVYVDPIGKLAELGRKLNDTGHPEFRLEEGICLSCRRSVQKKLMKQAKKIWDHLPVLFQLPQGC